MPERSRYFDIPRPAAPAARFLVRIKDAANSRSLKIRAVGAREALITKPRWVSVAEAMQFLEKNAQWLLEASEKIRPRQKLADYIKCGGNIYADGGAYEVDFIVSRTSPFYVDDAQNAKLVIAARAENFDEDAGAQILKFAAKKLEKLCREESRRTALEYSRISLRDQSGRWASRSASGTLSLNWRLMLLEPELQKYVVCHELAHTKFMDHSVSFWIFLNRICPDAQNLDRRVSAKSAEIFAVEL